MKRAGHWPGQRAFRRRLAALYILFCAAVLAGAWVYHSAYRRTVIDGHTQLIAAIGRTMAERVRQWRESRATSLEIAAYAVPGPEYLRRLAENSGDREALSLMTRRLQVFVRYSRFEAAYYIAGGDGRILSGTGPGPGRAGLDLLRRAEAGAGDHPLMSELGEDEEGAPALYMALRISGAGGKRVYLLGRLDPRKVLYPMLASWPVASRSGETLLVRRENGEVRYLNELRNLKVKAVEHRLPLAGGLVSAEAVQGAGGLLSGRDYRGVPALAWARRVAGSDWYVVSKIDESEIFAGLRRASLLMALLALALPAAGGLGLYALFARREAEYASALLASEARFARLYSQMLDAYVYMAMDGKIKECNPAYERLTGYGPDELKKLTYVDLTPEKWHGMERRLVEEEIISKGRSPVYEKEYRRKDGTLVSIELSTVLDRDAEGRPAGMWAIIRDLTARKEAEQAMKDSLDLLNEAQKLAGSGSYALDFASGRWTSSEGLDLVFGIGPGYDRSVEGWLALVHPEDREDMGKYLREEVVGKGLPFDREYRIIRRGDGELRRLHGRGALTFGPGGAPERMVGTIQDITGRRRREQLNAARLRLLEFSAGHTADELEEEALNEAEALTGSLIGFFHSVDEDQKTLVLQNWSTRTKRDYCRAEGKGRHYPEEQAGVWADALRRREPVIHNDYASLPGRKGLPEGYAALVREAVVPVLRGGRVAALMGVGNKAEPYTGEDTAALGQLADLAWDAVCRKRAEEEREESRAALAAKNRELEEFMYAASHDLRGPMVNVQGFAQNIKTYCGRLAAALKPPAGSEPAELLQKKMPEALDFLLGGAGRMDAMINALLRISRLSRAELQAESLDMDELAGDVVKSLAFQAGEAGAEIKAGPLPPCSGDKVLLSRVFANLLDNAIKYRAPGRKPEITITGRRAAGGWCEYEVSDNGAGISEEAAAGRLWAPFYRADGKAPSGGEGIGLAATRRIVERHGGSIQAVSRPEGGTLFRIRLRS